MGAGVDEAPGRGDNSRLVALASAQEALWYTQQVLGDIPLTIAQYIDISGDLDTAAVRMATDRVGRTLGTTVGRIVERDGRPALTFDADRGSAPFDVIDLRADADPIGSAHEIMDASCRAPMPLTSDHLTYSTLLRVGTRRWFLFSRAHHIVLDGYGAYVLLSAIAREYRNLVGHRGNSQRTTTDNSRAALSQGALNAYETDYRASPRFARDREYWSTVMSTMPGPVTIARRPAPPSVDPIRCSGSLTAALTSQLMRSAEQLQQNSTALIVAGLGLYLARASGNSVVALTLPVAARTTGALRRTAGSVSNLVPIVVDVRETMTLRDLVTSVSRALTGALRHQLYRYENVLRDQGSVSARISHVGPVLNIFPDQPVVELGDGLTAGYHVLSTGPVADLNINIYPDGGRGCPTIDFEANPDRYEPSTVSRHRENLITLLGEMCAAAATDPVGRIAIPAATHHDGPRATYPRPLIELLAQQYNSTSIAVIDGATALSHRDLARAVRRLAQTLRARGIGLEDKVAVVLPRSVAEVVAFHAVAAIGACYVPVDPRYPRVRQQLILADCGATIILRLETAESDATNAARTLRLGPQGEHDHVRAAACAPHPPFPVERAAYLIYTSGSTGTPKGVVVTDAGLGSLVDEIDRSYTLSTDSVVAHMSSPSFDTTVVEILAGAVSGSTLVVIPESVYGGGELAEHLTHHGVTHVLLTPGVLATLDPSDLPTVTHIIVGGDVCPPEVIKRFAAHAVVRCAYGPTETTCSVTLTEPIDPQAISALPVPIGHPMTGVRVQILDQRLHPVPTGMGGELYLSGPSVARGYLTNPSLTAERFVPDPTCPHGRRMYRTGDRAAWREDQSLEFLGRTDQQVKIRGIRVEPAEIDAVLRSQPGVDDAITLAVQHHRTQLLASYVTTSSPKIRGNVLRDGVAAELPVHMVPSSVTVLDEIPLTPAGKVDRTALPSPAFAATAAYRAPAGTDERVVVAAFREATGSETVGADDDFFELGGDSLSATQVVAALNTGGTTTLTVRDVFERRTPAALASRLIEGTGKPEMQHRDRPCGPHPLSPVQRNVLPTAPSVGSLIPFTVQIEAELHPSALAAAATAVVARHAMLRSRLVDGATVVDPVDIARTAVTVLADPDDAVTEFLSAPIDLARHHPIRFGVHVARGITTVAICAHHLYVDGWSLGIIARDLVSAYSVAADGGAAPWPDAPALTYLDYSEWMLDRLGDPADPGSLHHDQSQFWRNELAEITAAFATPSDRGRPHPWDDTGARIRVPVADVWPTVSSAAAVHAVSPTTVLRASLASLLCRLAATDEVVIGALTSGRVDTRLDEVVGMFVNTVPVLCRVDGGDVSAHLAQTAAAELRAMAHTDVPFADLARDLWFDDTAHPLFQIMLTVENSTPTAAAVHDAQEAGLTVTPRPPALAKCDLHVAVTGGDNGFVEVLYPMSMWDEPSVVSLVNAWFDDLRSYPGAIN